MAWSYEIDTDPMLHEATDLSVCDARFGARVGPAGLLETTPGVVPRCSTNLILSVCFSQQF